MPRFMPNATLVFSGLGYAADGPYLLVNDVYGKKQMQVIQIKLIHGIVIIQQENIKEDGQMP